MKIEIGESLGYSFLRHVKQCWLVQTNWTVSEHWAKHQTDEALEAMFSAMRENFDPDGSVFRGTKDCSQLLRQGEIDVVGVGQDGSVHAMEVAFHEAGLNYGGGADNRVLKKLLRTMLILNAYHPEETERHIYFVSPKVHPAVQHPMEEIFSRLQAEYSSINWHLLTNDEFTNQLLVPTLEKAGSVADTSELFVRSAKLLELAGASRSQAAWTTSGESDTPRPSGHTARLPYLSGISEELRNDTYIGPGTNRNPSVEPDRVQPLVRRLMKTLLEDYPTLLDDGDIRNLMRRDYCQDSLGLYLSGFPLLRRREEGREVSSHPRYYVKVYAGRYFVTKEWWKDYHFQNARSLLRWVAELISRRVGHPGVAALEKHRATLQNYLGYP